MSAKARPVIEKHVTPRTSVPFPAIIALMRFQRFVTKKFLRASFAPELTFLCRGDVNPLSLQGYKFLILRDRALKIVH